MKKFLLTAISAAFVACVAVAQPIAQPFASKISANAFRMGKSMANRNAGIMPVEHGMHTLAHENTTRDPKEISFQVTGNEISKFGYVPTGYNPKLLTQNGITGWGFGMAIPAEMMDRYVGNTISKINFYAYPGRYSDSKVFIGQLTNKGKIKSLWEKEVVVKGSNTKVNSYTCDYQIPDTLKGEVLIGWCSRAANILSTDTVATKYGITTYAYPDPTGNGLGALMFCSLGDGDAYLLDQLQYENLVISSPIWVETTGDAGLKYNDAALYYIDDVRGFAGQNDVNTLQVANMGLDTLRSFTYTVKTNEGEQKLTYNFKRPIPYFGSVSLAAPMSLPSKAGRSDALLTIDEVNGVADEYTEKEENEGKFNFITLENAYHRTPVIEELTSVSNGLCPLGMAGIKQVTDSIGENNLVTICIHGDDDESIKEDPLKANTYQTFFKKYAQALPQAFINREISTNSEPGSNFIDACRFIQSQPCEATMSVSSKNSLKGLSIEAKIKFSIDIPADTYGVTYVVTEDGVKADQLNYLAALYMTQPEKADSAFKSNPYIYPYCIADSKVEKNQYVFTNLEMNHVARYIQNASETTNGFLPATKAGEEITSSALIKSALIGANNKENLRVAALLLDKNTGKFITACQTKVGSSNTSDNNAFTGINNATVSADNSFAQIDAANGAFVVKAEGAVAQVYDAQGRLVTSAHVDGETSLPTWGHGVYVIRVTKGNQVTSQKAIF